MNQDKVRTIALKDQAWAMLRSNRIDIAKIAADGITPGESMDEAMRLFDLAQMMACAITADFIFADIELAELEL